MIRRNLKKVRIPRMAVISTMKRDQVRHRFHFRLRRTFSWICELGNDFFHDGIIVIVPLKHREHGHGCHRPSTKMNIRWKKTPISPPLHSQLLHLI
jgi:hypothetical protein